MSENYEAARSLIDDEVFANCKYYVYWELRDAVDGLESENERLRGLVRYAKALAGVLESNGCSMCPYDSDVDMCGVDTEPMREGCAMYEEMCELGVTEVGA